MTWPVGPNAKSCASPHLPGGRPWRDGTAFTTLHSMGQNTGRFFAGVLVIAGVAGCSSMQVMRQTVRARAVNDLHCPREQISVADLGIQVYSARGCNMKATYTVRGKCTEYDNCDPILNPESLKKTN